MKIDPLNEIELVSERLVLKVPDPTFSMRLLKYYGDNRDFFQLSMPAFNEKFFTREYQDERLWTEFELMIEDRGLRFCIFKREDLLYEKIIGDVSISNVIRGESQSCNLGFKLDNLETGKGFMEEALKVFIDYIFNELRLHRIEVETLPSNAPSIKLLKKLGFKQEGIAEKFLYINGEWKDHLRFSLINLNKDYQITTV